MVKPWISRSTARVQPKLSRKTLTSENRSLCNA